MSTIGYARVSSNQQSAAALEAQLRAAGATRVFIERDESPPLAKRPQWVECLETTSPGDVLLVPTLHCLGKSERSIIETLNGLAQRRVNITSLGEPEIDTTDPVGHTLFQIVAVFARLRAESIRENTARGLAIARSEGRLGGRPSVITPARLAEAKRMRAEGASIARIAGTLGVGASSVSRALSKMDSGQAPRTGQKRVFFRDTKPYEAVASLDELRGPTGGMLTLPHSIYWGPEKTVSLDTPSGIRKAYQAVLREGTATEQALILNRDVLEREWANLALPDRVRVLWENRFPALVMSVAA